MGTVSKQIADDVIAGKYPEDNAVKIVKYTNTSGGESYGVVFEGDNPDKYHESEYVINPSVYWTRPGWTEPDYVEVLAFLPPNGQKVMMKVTQVNPDDMAWFKANNVKLSMEDLNNGYVLYGDVGIMVEDIPDEAIELSKGRSAQDTFHALRKQCEEMLKEKST